jgi:hypothetical protein
MNRGLREDTSTKAEPLNGTYSMTYFCDVIQRYSKMFLIVGMVWIFAGCETGQNVGAKNAPVELIGEIQSYLSSTDLKEKLDVLGIAWEEEKGPSDSISPGRPLAKVNTILGKDFIHLGVKGRVEFSFLNDHLMSARFFPVDVDGYLGNIISKENIELKFSEEILLRQNLLIRFSQDYSGQRYFDWIDRRLEKEFDEWIRKYS